MPANTSPIFALTPNIGFAPNITAANTARDGTGTVDLVYTAGANGSYLQKIRCRALGANVQTVLRVFLNNGSTPTVATNNVLFEEMTLAITSATETSAQTIQEVIVNTALPAGWRVYVTLGTAVAAGVAVSGIGGDY
jgi:hypothetical protein